jgi:hypothetical protein
MIHFQVGVPWGRLKKPTSPYFSWLFTNEVFINQTKLKVDTLIPCGFLIGAHPFFLRRDEAKEKLTGSLGLPDCYIPFQLSSRNISVPITDGSTERYTFQAVIVETATSYAATLRGKNYQLEDPATATRNFPYTGGYQFVPMIKSKD